MQPWGQLNDMRENFVLCIVKSESDSLIKCILGESSPINCEIWRIFHEIFRKLKQREKLLSVIFQLNVGQKRLEYGTHPNQVDLHPIPNVPINLWDQKSSPPLGWRPLLYLWLICNFSTPFRSDQISQDSLILVVLQFDFEETKWTFLNFF